ncbi:ricin-type beta-trefoil lectin domain protein [Kitasatospora sp. NPDC048298]|uniref:ricin-type beta-trefoil lectin domain protein n=1 Tax=Kitasatospora sp. NPDC048298 TaxID=3364049 RepID=UPI003712BCA9
MRAITLSPAKRIATAAITAVLLGGTPGLATAATPQTALPTQLTADWYRLRIYPNNTPARQLNVDSSGKVVVSVVDPENQRQQWSLSGTGSRQLIKNRATGTCLTAPSDTLDPVTVQPCDKNNTHQQWDLHYVTSTQLQVSPRNHLSLALTGGAQAGSNRAVLRDYAAQANQQWAFRPVK